MSQYVYSARLFTEQSTPKLVPIIPFEKQILSSTLNNYKCRKLAKDARFTKLSLMPISKPDPSQLTPTKQLRIKPSNQFEDVNLRPHLQRAIFGDGFDPRYTKFYATKQDAIKPPDEFNFKPLRTLKKLQSTACIGGDDLEESNIFQQKSRASVCEKKNFYHTANHYNTSSRVIHELYNPKKIVRDSHSRQIKSFQLYRKKRTEMDSFYPVYPSEHFC